MNSSCFQMSQICTRSDKSPWAVRTNNNQISLLALVRFVSCYYADYATPSEEDTEIWRRTDPFDLLWNISPRNVHYIICRTGLLTIVDSTSNKLQWLESLRLRAILRNYCVQSCKRSQSRVRKTSIYSIIWLWCLPPHFCSYLNQFTTRAGGLSQLLARSLQVPVVFISNIEL